MKQICANPECERTFKLGNILTKQYCRVSCRRRAGILRTYPTRRTITRSCKKCGTSFTTTKPNGKYCSVGCRRLSSQCFTSLDSGFLTERLTPSTVGALSELMVCVDLLRRGWAVFRAMSPNCQCDLMAMKEGIYHRVEVTTCVETPKGSRSTYKSKHNRAKNDVVAGVVLRTQEIIYEPDYFGTKNPPQARS